MRNRKKLIIISCILLVLIVLGALPVYTMLVAPKAFQFPMDWPIPQLTLPAGSMQGTTPIFHQSRQNMVFTDDEGNKHWNVTFDGKYSFADLTSHLEAALIPLGYEKTHDQSTKSLTLAAAWSKFSTPEEDVQILVNYANKISPLSVLDFYPQETYFIRIRISNSPTKIPVT